MSLKYRDGYLCGYENLEPLPVEILEDIVLRIAADDYLSRDAKEDLLKEYLEERKHKLDKAFRYTDENLVRLREMNVLIEQQSIEAIRTAYRVYLDELAEKAEHPDTYVDMEIRPVLKVPADLYGREDSGLVFTDKEERIWDALCSPDNRAYRTFDMLPAMAEFRTSQPGADCEAVIRECVYGCQADEPFTTWGDVMNLDRKQVGDILFVWPFHNIYDFCCFAMSDLFKIKTFHLKIELTDEVL